MNNKIKPQTLLSTLWVFILFNMLLRDLHEFPTEGYVEKMMSLKLSEAEMLFYAFIVEVPISMIVLSRILNNKANKWANIIAIILSSIGILYTLPTGHLDEYFFAIANTIAFAIIITTIRKLPSYNDTQEKITLKNEQHRLHKI